MSRHGYVDLFVNDTATTEIYALSLHDALPICTVKGGALEGSGVDAARTMVDMIASMRAFEAGQRVITTDRKSTRLNSSHANISYAVFCLKKKKKRDVPQYPTL